MSLRHPALYYAILVLLGVAFALSPHWVYLIPLLLLIRKEKLISSALVCLAGFVWSATFYTFPRLADEGVEIEGRFRIDAIASSHSPFQRSIMIKGGLKQGWRTVPCHLFFNEESERPVGNCDYQIRGILIPKENHRYLLKPVEWHPIPSTYALAEVRYQIKNQIRNYLGQIITHSKSRHLLLSMLTGEIDDRLIALEFNRLGLLHLLGISGFQFVLLAFLIGTVLRTVLPYRVATIVLIAILSAYTLILGQSPPIERAWIGIVLYLIALLKGYRISPLNALGVAMMWQIVKEPLIVLHLGFQFSFLCTVAILTTYPALRAYFTERRFRETLQMPLHHQVGHIIHFFCKEAVLLNLSIHLMTLPLILFHFHKFPWLSLLYNLFLPGAVSIAYLLLILGLGLDLIYSPSPLHHITNFLTENIVKIATHPPALYDFHLKASNFSLPITVITLTAIIYLSLTSSRARSNAFLSDSER